MTTSKGQCAFCKESFSKNEIKRHLNACSARAKVLANPSKSKKAKQGELLHLVVEGEYLPMYWLHIEISAGATLRHLDQFLRDIWLECCGHLSAFSFGEQRYSVSPIAELNEKGMGKKLGTLFTVGRKAHYEYDFGSTTHLLIKHAGQRDSVFIGSQVTIMARNLPPEILCIECEAPATQLCIECMWDGEGQFCAEHSSEHECGEEMQLPVVNSPRVGVCAYGATID